MPAKTIMLNGVVVCPASEEESVLLEKTLLEKGYCWVHHPKPKSVPLWWKEEVQTCLRIELEPEKKWYQQGPLSFYISRHMNIWTVPQFLEYYGGKL